MLGKEAGKGRKETRVWMYVFSLCPPFVDERNVKATNTRMRDGNRCAVPGIYIFSGAD